MNKGYISLILLSIVYFSSPCFGEVSQDEIIELRKNIQKLNERLSDQEKRIQRLERLQNLKSPPISLTSPQSEDSLSQKKTELLLWHDPPAWRKVRRGMTHQQVIVILGNPTSISGVGDSADYVYEGEVPGSGYVKGVVNFLNNRVVFFDGPVFLNK